MKRKRLRIVAASVAVLAVLAAVFTLAMWGDGGMPADLPLRPMAATAIPFAVLGDSNSQSYHDDHWFPPAGGERGGALRATTFQWTEVLAQLRGRELDAGPWVRWGYPGVVARAREWLGLRGGRAPRKDDYLYNFANSGAACNNLMRGRFRQAPRLVALMDREPERWKRGVVVIRIGLNSWAGLMELQSRDPAAPELSRVTAYCAGEIGAAISLIHAKHPATRILVVGIANEADDPDQFDRFQSAAESANIQRALVGFNAALRALTQGDARVAFFDDAAWFDALWGARGPDGKPNRYKTVAVGPTLRVTNTAGDDPHNALLGDHHAGLAWNALWAQSLVARLREAFGLPLTPIGDDERDRFLAPLLANSPEASKAPGS